MYTRTDPFPCVLRRGNAADADDDKAPAGHATDVADDLEGPLAQRSPAQAALLAAVGGPHRQAIAREGGVGGDDPREAVGEALFDHGVELLRVEVRGDFEEEGSASLVPLLKAIEDLRKAGAFLELAEARGVRGADVDHKIIGDLLERVVKRRIVLDRVRHRGMAVLPKVHPDGKRGPPAAFPEVEQPRADRCRAGIVEAHAVDDRLLTDEAKQARAWVTALGQGGDRSDFHEAEAERVPEGDQPRVLVEPGGKTHRRREIESESPNTEGGSVHAQELAEATQQWRKRLDRPQRAEGDVVRRLRGKLEGEGTEETPGGGHGSRGLGAEPTEKIKGIKPGRVAVTPPELKGVAAHLLEAGQLKA